MATGQLLNVEGSDVGESVDVAMPFDATDRNTSAAGAAAVVTVTADSGRPIVISQIHAGYSAAPAAGATLKIEDGVGNTVWEVPVGAGPYQFDLTPAKASAAKNTALVVTLSAGGGAVVAYLNVNVRRHT